uniref:Cytoadhesion protein n=1 Tax=Anisakis simplex TaxID=6269 RepID=A0A0M3KJF6_ANISI
LKAQQAGDITLKARAQPELPHQNAAAAAAASRHRYSTDQHRAPLSKSERPRAAKPFAPVNGAQMRPPTAPIGQFRGQQPWSQVPQGVGQVWQQAPPFQQPQQPVQVQAQARFPAQFQPQQVQPQFQGQWPPPAQTQFLQPQPQVPQGRWPGQFPAQNPQFVPSAQRLPSPPQMSRFQVAPSAARPPPPPPLAQRSRVLPAQAVQPAQQASALIPWNQRQQPPRQIL